MLPITAEISNIFAKSDFLHQHFALAYAALMGKLGRVWQLVQFWQVCCF
jgi:hypothetical protein